MTTPDANVTSRAAPLGANDPQMLGSYTLLGKLGQGGMGTVYLGRSELGRLVAIKVIRADVADDPQFRSRFRQEAATARRVARVCTAEVLDFDPDAEYPYLVTEFIEGPTLANFVARNGPLADANLEQLAVGVAAALRAIHAAGIVHRDLKPSNVVLSPFGPRVIDFGIARALDAATSLTGDLQQLGTPAFMSPEQITGGAITSKADIWAWGGLVTYAATGTYPFGVGSAQVLLYRAQFEEPHLDGVDPALRPIVWDAMRKNPADRPSAAVLMDRLLGDDTQNTTTGEDPVTQVLADWKLPAPASGGPVPATRGGAHEQTTLATTRPTGSTGQPGLSGFVPSQVASPAATPPPVSVPGGAPPYGDPGAPPPPAAPKPNRTPLYLGIAALVIAIAVLATVLPLTLGGKNDTATGTGGQPAASAPAATPFVLPAAATGLRKDTAVLSINDNPSSGRYRIVSAQIPDPTDGRPTNRNLVTGFTTIISTNDDLKFPAISQDRKTVFFVDVSDTPPTIWSMASDGEGQPLRLFTSGPASKLSPVDDGRPSLSPDGRFMVLRSTTDQDGNANPGLYITSLDGQTVRRLNTEPLASDPSWSPDGEKIAYWSNTTSGEGGFLVLIGAQPGAVAEPFNKDEFLSEGDHPNLDFEPVWSPDGKFLAFIRQIGGEEARQELQVVNVNTKHVLGVTSEPSLDDEPAWAPDANGILLFTANRDHDHPDDRQLYMSDINHPEWGDRRLTSGTGDLGGSPRWGSG